MSTSRKKAAPTGAKSKAPAKSGSRAKAPAAAKKTAAKKTPTAAPEVAQTVATLTPPPAAKPVEPVVVDAPQAVIMGPVLRKKELIDTVVSRSGMKKKDVKPIVETMLNVLGDALRDNRELKLPPMGHLKTRREKQLPNGRMVVAKIRQTNPPVPGTQDATDPAEEA